MNKNTSTDAAKAGTSSAAYPTIRLERIFAAPAERLWKAWAEPELVKQWWGPTDFTCPEAKSDFRVGGQYLYAMKGPDGTTTWSGGVFKEISPEKKLVYTDQFTDESGNAVAASVYGMDGDWPEGVVTITFEALDDEECRMQLVHDGIPAKWHDDCVQGWELTLDKLQKLVERH